MTHPHAAPGVALPKIGKPATRALAQLGVTTLDPISTMTEAQLLAIHGVGPKAVRILREALAERGLSFAESPRPGMRGEGD